jgi:indolepyruvate ferredoxin oxidoreductase alpha subunit
MQKLLLLGDEAIAQAALDAGISGIYAYPGTPSTEIMENVQASKQAKKQHPSSMVGQRKNRHRSCHRNVIYRQTCHCCMKHVGLNVAATDL